MQFAYLSALLFSIAGMVTLDYRYKLALFTNTRATILTVLTSVGVFVLWDATGIGLGIFFSGKSQYMSGLYLAPEFPIEELFFLTFLCYFALIIYRLGGTVWQRT